ncbi:MAG: hypothetical protein LBR00_04060 [Clostridiales Family XIII bacterium]|jgi:pyrroline-5-carboxylate reductase|nr:hypothetical protein [Clostridiales Family XIII bacterium]
MEANRQIEDGTFETFETAKRGYAECVPALAYSMMIAMVDAGCRIGFGREEAQRQTVATMRMTSKLLNETKRHPHELSDAWAAQGGVAIETLYDTRRSGTRGMVIEAARAAQAAAGKMRPDVLTFPYAVSRQHSKKSSEKLATTAPFDGFGAIGALWMMDLALAMIYAGVDAGLSHAEAREVALGGLRNVADAAEQTGLHPVVLRDRLMNLSSAASAAVTELETNGFYATLAEGMVTGCNR